MARILRDPGCSESWASLGSRIQRAPRPGLLSPLQPLRSRLRRLLLGSDHRLVMAPVLEELLGVEALPTALGGLPRFWQKPSHRPQLVSGIPRDRETGLALRVRHRDSGIELLYVPGGSAWNGRQHASMTRHRSCPGRRVCLRGFYLGRFPVTRGESSGPGAATPSRGEPGPGATGLPRTGWNRDQAAAFCRQLGGRLPGEEEWERAGRGRDARSFPWGDVPSEEAVPGGLRGRLEAPRSPEVRVPVGNHPDGASPFGIEELSGHLAEFCLETWGERCALRGGSQFREYRFRPPRLQACNLLNRRSVPTALVSSRIGFRLCLPLAPGPPPRPPLSPPQRVDHPELEPTPSPRILELVGPRTP